MNTAFSWLHSSKYKNKQMYFDASLLQATFERGWICFPGKVKVTYLGYGDMFVICSYTHGKYFPVFHQYCRTTRSGSVPIPLSLIRLRNVCLKSTHCFQAGIVKLRPFLFYKTISLTRSFNHQWKISNFGQTRYRPRPPLGNV